MLPVFRVNILKYFFFFLKSILKGLNHIYIEKKMVEKCLSKITIVKVRGGGRQGMVKDHTFTLFNFWTLPEVC